MSNISGVDIFKAKKLYKEWLATDDPKEFNMYKVRWVWYHTILGVELFLVVLLLLGIYLKL